MISRVRVMTVVLVVSLAFNLLIVGGITTRIMTKEARPIPPNLSWIMDNLSEETKAQLFPQLQEFGESTRPLRRAIFRAQRQVNELMMADPMDHQAIAAAFEQLRQASLEYQKVSHEQTTQVFELLTPEQRVMALRFLRERKDPDRHDRDSSSSSNR